MKKFIYISGIVIINIFVFGALLKIMHWPGANILITMGLSSFCLCFLPTAMNLSYKGNGKKFKSLYIAGFICAFITFIGAMFKIEHWQGAGWFLIVGIPLPFLYFLPVYIYHQNKAKETSALNLLGIMFLMVYIAIFSAILALNVSRDILEAFNTDENDISKTNVLFANENKQMYENLEKSGEAINKEKLIELKTKSDALFNQIYNIKAELVKSADGSNSQAIEAGNKINASAIFAKDESAGTTKIMRGDDGVSGKAAELKKQINDYSEYLKSLTQNDSKSLKIINTLLSTVDAKDTLFSESVTTKWEDQYFPNGSYIVSTLVSLSSIETNVRLAESEALSVLKN
jgi:hypothetical protein